jgi:hypothetical protein
MLGRLVLLAALAWPGTAAVEDYQVATEHPRLFLTRQRLRLLQRERERRSARWVQLEALVAGGAPMPEPGLTEALMWRVTGNREAGQRAVRWALGAGRDLRQTALVFDWCQDLLDEAQAKTLEARLRSGMAQGKADESVPAARARVLAAVALAGHAPDNTAAVLESVAETWWEGRIVKTLKNGTDALPSDDCYALFELLHAMRDNLTLDLRQSDADYFKELPVRRLLSYYPAPYPAGENEYRIPAAPAAAEEPDLTRAALARAADLAMVAYDLNSPGGQVLQGWLMHDQFQLRGVFGAAYEFLWANPYQPGLSYYHVPLICHDRRFGRLFVRSTWDSNAQWLGTVNGQVQLFRDGGVKLVEPSPTPLALTEALVFFGARTFRFKVQTEEEEQAFVMGLKPGGRYQVEVDEEEAREDEADRGGILPIDLPAKAQTGFRFRELP